MEIKDLKYFAKGKRSKVYTGRYGNYKVGVKISERAKLEAKWLKLLNKYGIGPKFLFLDENKLVYRFVEGKRIKDYLKVNKDKKVVKEVLRQCRILDKLKIDKKELVNPYKHILVGKKVVMIDFERCHYVDKAKNVTQFFEFLFRIKFLKRDNIEVLKKYKKNQNDKNFEKILRLI